jgi:hypothetical protein
LIAFAYCHTGPKMAALYSGMVEGLVKNIKEVMPGESILFITDDHTPVFKGVSQVLRIPRTVGLMTWRLKCHQMAHEMANEIIFVEPDVRFQASVLDGFDGGFDVAITSREPECRLDNERINTDFTFGMTFSRSGEFWRQCKIHCQTLSPEDQDWFGDMLSIDHVVKSGAFNVKLIDGSVYNHVVNDPSKPTDAKVLHYKGKRKAWLFPRASEAV